MLMDQEELARAELYGLLANIYLASPPAALLEGLSERREPVASDGSASNNSALRTRWVALVDRAGSLSVAEVADEFDALFGGVGKPDIFLHASWFLAGFLNEKPLATLRGQLSALGIERVPGTSETEDHISSLFEVMRFLITDHDPETCTLVIQRDFFDAHVRSWANLMCDAINAHPRADFYRAVAELTREFLAIEAQAFDLIDAVQR